MPIRCCSVDVFERWPLNKHEYAWNNNNKKQKKKASFFIAEDKVQWSKTIKAINNEWYKKQEKNKKKKKKNIALKMNKISALKKMKFL